MIGEPPAWAARGYHDGGDAMNDANELNLTARRTPVSVWSREGWDGTQQQLTLSRWLVGIGGGALAIQGLRQRSIPGSLLAAVGGSLAWWALTGRRRPVGRVAMAG